LHASAALSAHELRIALMAARDEQREIAAEIVLLASHGGQLPLPDLPEAGDHESGQLREALTALRAESVD